MPQIYIGCAVWGYKDWIGDLFPKGSKNADFLSLYSRRLTTVEGNTTFYAIPKPEVVQRWAGADSVIEGSRGTYIDAKHLAVAEAFMGSHYGFASGPTVDPVGRAAWPIKCCPSFSG